MENDLLHEAAQPLIHHAPAHERFAFIHRLRGRFTAKRLCRILVIDRSNYYFVDQGSGLAGRARARGSGLVGLIIEVHTAYPATGPSESPGR